MAAIEKGFQSRKLPTLALTHRGLLYYLKPGRSWSLKEEEEERKEEEGEEDGEEEEKAYLFEFREIL